MIDAVSVASSFGHEWLFPLGARNAAFGRLTALLTFGMRSRHSGLLMLLLISLLVPWSQTERRINGRSGNEGTR